MAKADAVGQVRATLQSLKDFVASQGTLGVSEADTRVHFIDPILTALGYTALGEIQREVYVQDTRDFIDYALRVDGQQRIAVEAKRLGHKLAELDAGQLIKYCAVLGIEWAVLTNGREWRLYHQFAQVPLADKLLFTLDLVGWQSDGEFQALFDQLWLLSKDAFAMSDGPGAWQKAQRLDEWLRDTLTNAASSEAKWLRKRAGEQQLDVSAEDLAGWFKSRLLEPAPIPGPSPVAVTPQGQTTDKAQAAAVSESYWMVPASSRPGLSASECLHAWLGKGMWGFGEGTPSRKALREGDWIAFYAVGSGVLAYAQLSAAADTLVEPAEWPEALPQKAPTYKIPVANVTWLTGPVVVSAALRARLEAFAGRDVQSNWSWLVQTTRRLSEADFRVLTGKS